MLMFFSAFPFPTFCNVFIVFHC